MKYILKHLTEVDAFKFTNNVNENYPLWFYKLFYRKLAYWSNSELYIQLHNDDIVNLKYGEWVCIDTDGGIYIYKEYDFNRMFKQHKEPEYNKMGEVF